MTEVQLVSLEASDREQFIKDNQEAFNYGAMEEFGLRDAHFEDIADEQIISSKTIEACIDTGEAYRIIADGTVVGGAVIKVSGTRGDLELLFIKPEVHSKGIGFAAWCEIEKLHPDVTVWETFTPYFETRNIHFYVNRCGFHIVEYLNKHHPGDFPADEFEGKDPQFPAGMFRFEKQIKKCTSNLY
ncbi:GNAT family N-acetyltransferase [uncultured Ruminococcus sp.]|uniref:GNAT family N-acetyltransferase n=1 Tax=uncultured Ruminococcus sp. TaxID=165186 RepID=UPI0025FCADD0|nr:GNAT family N-acetyltransferase [uncultured Ruminococcus sp.]